MSHVRCPASGVRCHVSGVTCNFFFYLFFFFDKAVKLVGGGSVINGAYPVWFIRLEIFLLYTLYLKKQKPIKSSV